MPATTEEMLEPLRPHLPADTLHLVADLFAPYDVAIKISRPRSTKLGDYRPPYREKGHRISVNRDLNQYSFLITLIHELAHLIIWEEHKNKVKPHGEEWKGRFRESLLPFVSRKVFPPSLEEALANYLANPKATSCSDSNLMKALREFDAPSELVMLEDLPESSIFVLHGKRIFVKGKKLRKRYRCMEVHSRKQYLIHQLAEVRPMEDPA